MGNELALFGETEIKVIKSENVLGKDFKIYGTVDEPLFLAKEIAEWIEHSDVSMMLKSVDDDEKLTQTMFVSGQNRNYWFLTENGLYEVLMQSRKPIAKEFKKAVKKVLHSLRINGGYIANQENLTEEELMAKALLVAHKVIANKDRQIAEMKPMADGYKLTMDSDGTYSMAETAKLLKLPYGNVTLFKKLRDLNLLDKNNIPLQEYVNRGYFTVITKPIVKGSVSENKLVTRVTAKGVDYIAKKLGILIDAA